MTQQSDLPPHSASKQYAPIANIPLIKSPSLRTPVPVPIPPDVHPLPESVTAYFVYPFTLEPHVLTLESSRQSTLQAHQSRNVAYLRAREDEKLRRQREALRRIAPGFEPSGSTLVPTRITQNRNVSSPSISMRSPPDSPQLQQLVASPPALRDVMDDLVDQLAAIDSAKSNTSS